MTAEKLRVVDQTGLKTGQALTILLLLAAFVIGLPVGVGLVFIVAVAQLLGALDVPFGPYRLVYKVVVRRFNLAAPNLIQDNPEPHRFAMLVGAVFNFSATLLLLVGGGGITVGWVLVWIVIALANLNFWLNFCLGCWMYYQFNRLGVPGFTVQPLQ